MTNIQIFNSPTFGKVRTTTDEQGEPLFCLKDVCVALELDGKQVARRLDKGVVSKHPLATDGGKQTHNFVNEDGLYDVILESRKAEAKAFRKWITSEVLPQIRKTGGYIPIEEHDDEKVILAKAVAILKNTVEQKDKLIESQRPKVQFANEVTSSDGSILISEMAKMLTQNGYEMGRTRFFSWLREQGYLFKRSTEPIQKWVTLGIFDVHIGVINVNRGRMRETITTKVTPKGQKYFLDLFLHPTFNS